jgi:hypothetical protein
VQRGGSRVADDAVNNQGKDKKKPGSGSPEKKNLMTAGIAIVLVIIAVIAVAGIIQLPAGKGSAQVAVIKNFTPTGKGVSSEYTLQVRTTIIQSGTRTVSQTTPLQITPSLPVDFILQPGDPASCGLTCRQLDASITNTGYETAHNVCIMVDLHNSRDEIIYLNGEPSINRCVGDISGGQKKTESITINADCGAFATKCIGETLTLQTRVTSTEKTVRFPDQVIAV